MAELLDLSFRELLVKCGVTELFFDGDCDGERAICWTRLAASGTTFILAVSNGNDIWRTCLQRQDLETQKDIFGIETLDEFLEMIKTCFESGTVAMIKVGNKIVVKCTAGKTIISFDLYESKMSERKIELRYILFHLTDKMNNFKQSLAETKEALEGERRKEKGQSSAMEGQNFGFEPSRKTGQGSTVRRKHGHSLVNPNSKKAKKAKGISFE